MNDGFLKEAPASAATDTRADVNINDLIYYSNVAAVYATKLNAIKAVLDTWVKSDDLPQIKQEIIANILKDTGADE